MALNTLNLLRFVLILNYRHSQRRLYWIVSILNLSAHHTQKVLLVSYEIGVAEDTPGILFPSLVKAVHVELNKKMKYLADEAVDVAVAEVFGKNNFLKFVDVLDDKLGAACRPKDNLVELRVLFQKILYI